MKYKLIKKGELITGYFVDENGEYTKEEAERIVICQKIDATEDDYNKKIAEKEAEWTANEYARSRKAEYDALNQLEMQFDDKEDGTTTWEDAIKAIKTKYPKG